MTAPRVVVVGAGISGLAAAHRLRQRLGPAHVRVVDRAPQAGGKISTLRRDGLVMEEGPDSFLTTKPEGVALCRELGIAPRLVGTLPASPRGYVRRGGTLHPIPEGMSGLVPARLGGILRTRLLSLPGKLRLCAERLVPALATDADESVAAFIRRRFGAEAYEHLFEPLLGGIYAGNGDTLSLAATYPQLRTLERRYGSVLRGLGRERSKRADGATPPFVSFPTGMAELVEALLAAMSDVEIHRSTGVRAISRREGHWMVHLDDAGPWECDGVILATPAHEAARLLRNVDDGLSGALARIPHVSSTTVTLALPRREVAGRLPSGHGLLSPRAEGGPIVAWTFVDQKFQGRA
ncbi:MAG TPA: protoporphyrinogen oxidase, partial [Anaeromyxobacteraceae bacterium]|nr:protoporphyrinogen oxidase [Anaeromyxobacteraceae bacterium]